VCSVDYSATDLEEFAISLPRELCEKEYNKLRLAIATHLTTEGIPFTEGICDTRKEVEYSAGCPYQEEVSPANCIISSFIDGWFAYLDWNRNM
jgi:hypothetical protein